jgi:hypothetical protein
MITSIIITNPKDWADESILLPHELIRNAILKMESVLSTENFGENLNWKIEYFHKWYDNYFYNFVHHHHQIEEEIYFPFLKTKAIIPDKVVNDHTSLIKQLDEIKEIYDINILREKVQELKNNMFEHLAEEEQIVPTILRENFTQNEEKEIVGKIIQSLGLSGNKMALPWIIDSMKLWCSKDKIDDLYNSLPLFIKLFYNCNWIYDYKRNNKGLLQAILNNKPIKKCIC